MDFSQIPNQERFSELWVSYGENLTNVRKKVRTDFHATYMLGVCLVWGLLVKKDEARGVFLLEEASNAGIPEAATTLAHCYEHGLGVERSAKMARDLRGYASFMSHFSTAPRDAGHLRRRV